MHELIHRLGLIVVLTSTFAACGGSTTGDPSSSGGQSNAGGGAGVGGGTGNSCDVVTFTSATVSCADAAACLKTQCGSALAQCLGSDYLAGNYGASPCAEYGNCVKGCNCDSTCSNRDCALSTTCQTCLNGPLLTCAAQQCAAAYAGCFRG